MPRVQVILSEQARDRFHREAAREGLSLSAWFRAAGEERLERARAPQRFTDVAALDRFFSACDAREPGQEPDWEDHLRVMTESRASGAGST